MNIQELLSDLDKEYEYNMVMSSLFFNKWIEAGEDVYKERELLHLGAANLSLKLKSKLEVANVG